MEQVLKSAMIVRVVVLPHVLCVMEGGIIIVSVVMELELVSAKSVLEQVPISLNNVTSIPFMTGGMQFNVAFRAGSV